MSATSFTVSRWTRYGFLTMLACALCACGGGGGESSSAANTPSPSADPESTQPSPSAPPPVSREPVELSQQDAIRLLEQATFGPTTQDLAKVSAMGVSAYLDEQFAQPKTGYVGFNKTAYVQPDDCKMQANDPASAASICARTHYTLFELQRQFFANAMSGEDQLRQRVAFALSQLFVVSGTEVKHAAGMASYQNLLLDHAFGNFRELLEEVALHPVMGAYLDMANNAKGNPSLGTKPNENFARELLQLFTLGTTRLRADGTPVTDANGDALPAYTQADVEALARVFTGWTYSPWNPQTSRWVNPIKLVGAMVPIDSQHDVGSKQLLGVDMPPNRSAHDDLEAALDTICAHPNVAPFIATRLIQHLVTSNPTPAYIARIAAVFDDNGQGVRGDLQAVVRAILLDPEARGDIKTDSSYGKLREPALFMTGFLRALGGKSDGVLLRAQSAALGQDIFTAPSVFNYYSPLQRIGDGELYGPEFGLYDGASALERIDFVYQLVYAGGANADPTVPNSFGTSISFDGALGLTGARANQNLSGALLLGKLSQASSDALDAALSQLAADDELARERVAAYALGVSAQYQVQR